MSERTKVTTLGLSGGEEFRPPAGEEAMVTQTDTADVDQPGIDVAEQAIDTAAQPRTLLQKFGAAVGYLVAHHRGDAPEYMSEFSRVPGENGILDNKGRRHNNPQPRVDITRYR